MDDKTRTELEAAAFRRLVAHLRERTDVQNIDLMNLAGFCRNCLSQMVSREAAKQGIEVSDPEAREIVYGMPYDEWKAKHQKEASGDQKKAFDKARPQALSEACLPRHRGRCWRSRRRRGQKLGSWPADHPSVAGYRDTSLSEWGGQDTPRYPRHSSQRRH